MATGAQAVNDTAGRCCCPRQSSRCGRFDRVHDVGAEHLGREGDCRSNALCREMRCSERICSPLSPTASSSSTNSTVIRVPAMTGLPIKTAARLGCLR